MAGMELPNQDKMRRVGEKKPYKFFGILKVDTTKQVEMKVKKNISGEQENYSKPNYITGTS